MTAQDLVERHQTAWLEATRAVFLDRVREGTLHAGDFDLWLVQDHHFVAAELRFQARLLAVAPRADQALLASGLVALEAELSWFESHIESRGLDLDEPLRPAAAAYVAYLEALLEDAYGPALTALWTLERAYLEAWRGAAPAAEPYREFVEHWTTYEFEAYVRDLESAVDRAGADAEAFLTTAALERQFWTIAG